MKFKINRYRYRTWIRSRYQSTQKQDNAIIKWRAYTKRLIRKHKIFPRLIANELISVQPMEKRQAQIFYLDVVKHEDCNTDRSGIFNDNELTGDVGW